MRYLQVCVALYDYDARTPDEINIKENDTLYVIEKEDDDWWKAEVKQVSNEEPGPIGLVPATYLEEVTPIGQVRAEYDYDAQQEEELSFSEGQDMWLLESDDPDWYLVKLNNGAIGLAPANYVQDIEKGAPPHPSINTNASPPVPVQTSVHSSTSAVTPSVTPLSPLTQPNMQTKTSAKDIDDEALSWTVHDYDVIKKKKKKSKGNLLVGNAMLCYGSETDKTSPVQQYPILDVSKYLFDGKNLHIEIDGSNPAVLDLQASSKSEAKAILVKITDSRKVAQVAGTHVSQKMVTTATTSPISSSTTTTSTLPVTAAPTYDAPARHPSTSNATSPSTREPRWATSLYAFDAEGGEEISIEENQQILVTDYDRDDGWWRVETTDGRSGILPTSYIEFYDDANNTDNSHNDGQRTVPDISQGHHDDVDREAHDEVEAYMREKEARDRQDQLALERQIEQTEQAERQRRQVEAEKAAIAAEEEQLRMADQQRRDEEERERRRKVQEAAQRAEVVRQRQMEEDRRKRETTPRSSSNGSGGLSRSISTRQDLPKPDPDRLRTWTDRSGSFKVEAQFLAYTDGKLRLHKANGVKIDVPLERMSAEDIRWVERRTNQPVGSTKKGSQSGSAERTPEMPPRSAPTITTPASSTELSSSSSNNNNSKGTVQAKKTVNSSWDWFDWFMMIGIPMQEALVYSSAFKADNLDDSDLEKLTHKQMKMLGMKEEHVQRAERYIDTGKVESLDEEKGTNEEDEMKRQKQIEADEEMARRLQESWENGTGKKASSRPKPSVSAPKDIHPDLLEFLGSSTEQQPKSTSDDNTNAGNDLIGFSDDAWAPRPTKESSQSQGQQPLLPQHAPQNQPIATILTDTAPQQQSPTPIAPPAPTASSAPPVVQPQPIAEVISTQATVSPSIAAPPQQSQSRTIDPSLLQWQTSSSSSGALQPANSQRPSLNQLSQQEELRKYQQQQRQQSLLEQQQQIIMQQQQHIQQQQIQQQQIQLQQQQQQHNQLQQQMPLATGFQPNNVSSNSLVLHNNSLQSQMTGYGQPQMQNYQVTGYMPSQQQQTGVVTISNTATGPAAGQPMYQQPQATGRHWHTSTPDNPFGSPSLASQSLTPQMTGAIGGMQFSTPNPNAFTSSPMQQQQPTSSSSSYLQQLQPQMTGIQQTELSGARDKYAAFRTPNADVFTPTGSMQHGQSGFPQQQGYQPGRGW
ncbi:hypothetical protein BCR42DRAFT_446948 [Absidia repens]|uniref:Actin cytoskeleton-regulatory complex protein SLA1 n=1 Tax=Absidia repens TaxID=90262 RepID=A0A1X2IVZ1_9FUNG|nr:hypothetical protein BCR42DRAFT_446948 [Absidia repens]